MSDLKSIIERVVREHNDILRDIEPFVVPGSPAYAKASRTVDDLVLGAIGEKLGMTVTLKQAMDLACAKRVVVRRYEHAKLSVYYLDGEEIIRCNDPVIVVDGDVIRVTVESSGQPRS
ncbi:hypothetical protein [Pseudomonas monteilii]|uniref:hypothetical protein n=1 Tax=Pseudomonas monteilii TaxID=76759 RepID=UPI001E3915BD|nr:hypothetical protein [Pseudomonas monteilii]MCE0931647.1 hypothetical protein [Pseudomonas monteilii]MCE1007477.1 hypothetical protein [Pseudomonas monteilii]WJN90195.1 hypothetical protein LU680_09900 [Pseudomonas monteilii]WJO34807.1 hypothetical protein LU690_08575 [Pseudomonas monteilii]WJR41152.1 hypothetical protein LU662_009150 [Pseudomonas monteilii]